MSPSANHLDWNDLTTQRLEVMPLSAGRGSRNETTRRHNLSAVLTRVHHQGSISRAELTRQTGLNRSTIGALVSELADLGLVTEQPAIEERTVGRPSPIVAANPQIAALAINPDIDAIVLGLIGLGGHIHKTVRYPTDRGPSVQETIRIVTAIVDGMRDDLENNYRIVGMGLAIPGLVMSHDGLVTNATNLGWKNEPLGQLIEESVGYPTSIGNDATVGVISEALYGAGRGVRDFIYLDGLPSGVGGGVIVGGTPLLGFQGFGGELGHLFVKTDGRPCHCGRHGCLETEVNFKAIKDVLGRPELTIAQFDEILALDPSPALLAEIDRQAEVLAQALATLVTVLNPELVVLGGFIGSILNARRDSLVERMRELSFAPIAAKVRVEVAAVRNHTVLRGAAELAFQPVLRDPTAFIHRSDPAVD